MLQKKTVSELLSIHFNILKELQRRKLVRSANNPIADIAERIAQEALELTLVKKSTAGYDAADAAGNRYEIKARRPTQQNPSRQLSYIRDLNEGHFTHLIGVLFTEDFKIMRACIVPITVVKRRARYDKHTNGWRLLLEDHVWNEPTVRDVTKKFQKSYGEL